MSSDHNHRKPPSVHYAPPPRLSRASYPSFLSLQESVQLQVTWVWRGLYEANRWGLVIQTILGDAEIRANTSKSLLLNTLSLISIYAFDYVLSPLVKDQSRWLHRNVGWFYQILWLLPVVGASYYLNSTWCAIIAKRTFTLKFGNRSMGAQATTYNGLVTAVATSAYRAVMLGTTVVITFALGRIPYAGAVANFFFMCWIDAYYCFEFVWVARDMSLSRRIRHLEERWAYYLGFGLPSTILCNWGSSLASVAVFALVYPLFIIMSIHAMPVPEDPYDPVPTSRRTQDSDVIRLPSPFIPIRLPIFAIVIWLNDLIVKTISVGGAPRKRPGGHGRTLSDFTERMEDGRDSTHTPSPAARPRINLGRRKAD